MQVNRSTRRLNIGAGRSFGDSCPVVIFCLLSLFLSGCISPSSPTNERLVEQRRQSAVHDTSVTPVVPLSDITLSADAGTLLITTENAGGLQIAGDGSETGGASGGARAGLGRSFRFMLGRKALEFCVGPEPSD